ncbi:unnamed protein product [Protopolystoma xenopodis]|uniref:Uncharacterized protein n=1 Tax=Protopolystoma xenopodis TaxID=117903 RepID=A0A448XML7_9PLAT|nr:unnamed protein product [Protopolystoma xenopodis]
MRIGLEAVADTTEIKHSFPEGKECSRVCSKDCEHNYIGEIGKPISTRIKEDQRKCRKMDAERSEIAEHIALIGYTIAWNATERLASNGENTRKRKIRGSVDILF